MTNYNANTEVQFVSSQPSNSEPSQSSQQSAVMPAPTAPRHTTNLTDILNDDEPRPQLILDDSLVNGLHRELVDKSSGCSLEQLEQINAALMDAIWQHRADYNRNAVLKSVGEAFNIIIRDIQAMQDILKSSQEQQLEAQLHQYQNRFDGGTQFPVQTQPDWSQSQAAYR